MDIEDYESEDYESEDYDSSEYDDELSEQDEEESPYESGMKKSRPLIGAIIDNDIGRFHNLIITDKNYINDIGEKGKYEGLPIKYAIMYKRKEITELLIDNENFNVHLWIKMTKDTKDSVLYNLVDRNLFDTEFTIKIISKILNKLDSNEKKIVLNTKGFQTVLSYAIDTQQDIRILELLLVNGANPNIPDAHGNTPLMSCIINYRNQPFDLCQLLLSYGADPNLNRNSAGYTALMFACRNKQNFLIIELLLENSNIDIQTNDGNTLLMEAVIREANEKNPKEPKFFGIRKQGNIKIIAMILEHNPDVDIVNNSGKTVFDLIDAKYTSKEVSSMLFKYRRLKITEYMMSLSLRNPSNEYDKNIDNFPNVASLISGFLDGKSKRKSIKRKSIKRKSIKRKSIKRKLKFLQ
jgi:ankyrin repeat protein